MSKQATCAAQLRQIYLAMMGYNAEHNGRFTPYLIAETGKAHQYWTARMRPYFSLPVTRQWADNDPTDIYHCPTDTRSRGAGDAKAPEKNGAYGLCGLNGLAWGVWAYPNGTKSPAWRDGFLSVSLAHPGKTAMLFDHDQIFASTPEHLRLSQHAFRHRGQINVVYFDGHIGSLTKEEIPEATDAFWTLAPLAP